MKNASRQIDSNKRRKSCGEHASAHSKRLPPRQWETHLSPANPLWVSFCEALGSSLDLQGATSRLRTVEKVRSRAVKKLRHVSDADAIRADWEQTGSDLRSAIKTYRLSENRPRINS